MILGKFKGSGKLPVKHNLVYTRKKDKIYTLEMYKLPCIYYVNIHDMLHDTDYTKCFAGTRQGLLRREKPRIFCERSWKSKWNIH